MEVHHHSHTERKKWTHYFWEFLMLFLAVTLGFFVENQREHFIEHKREKQFMVSLINDLTDDIKTLDYQIKNQLINVSRLDSFVYLLMNPTDITNQLYYLGRISSRNDIFNYNTRTIDQMRNSGAFRLVRRQDVSNLIIGYYNEIKLLEMLESIEKKEEEEYRKMAVRAFDPLVFNTLITEQDTVIRPTANPPLRSSDPQLLGDMAGMVHYLKSTRLGLTQMKRALKDKAGELILRIKEAYHVD
jgi:hypothetical protein